MDSNFATSHVITLSCTIYYMTVSAAESNKIGPDSKAGSGPKKHGNGDKMSCSDRGTASNKHILLLVLARNALCSSVYRCAAPSGAAVCAPRAGAASSACLTLVVTTVSVTTCVTVSALYYFAVVCIIVHQHSGAALCACRQCVDSTASLSSFDAFVHFKHFKCCNCFYAAIGKLLCEQRQFNQFGSMKRLPKDVLDTAESIVITGLLRQRGADAREGLTLNLCTEKQLKVLWPLVAAGEAVPSLKKNLLAALVARRELLPL
eukprot:9207-Heterococcus_DN1.PRE.2